MGSRETQTSPVGIPGASRVCTDLFCITDLMTLDWMLSTSGGFVFVGGIYRFWFLPWVPQLNLRICSVLSLFHSDNICAYALHQQGEVFGYGIPLAPTSNTLDVLIHTQIIKPWRSGVYHETCWQNPCNTCDILSDMFLKRKCVFIYIWTYSCPVFSFWYKILYVLNDKLFISV